MYVVYILDSFQQLGKKGLLLARYSMYIEKFFEN